MTVENLRMGRAAGGSLFVECPTCKERIHLPEKLSRLKMEDAGDWLRAGLRLHAEHAHGVEPLPGGEVA